MQILVLYYSRSGHTRTLAEEVARGVESTGATALLKDTSQVDKEDFTKSAGVVAGSPVYFGVMAAELKKVFDDFVSVRKKMEDKVGAAFATAGHATGGKETTIISILQCMMIYGMIIVGDPMSATGHYGVACVGSPDENAASDAYKLGARVGNLCQQLEQGKEGG